MSTEIKEYVDTMEQCQSVINQTKLVCSHCGGDRVPIETVDNSGSPTFWPGCNECGRFDYGVPEIVYQIAAELVDKHNYIHYSHIDSPRGRGDDYKKYYRHSQIGGATSIVRDVLRIHNEILQQTESQNESTKLE